jgi:hypothetical protein
LIVTSGIDDAPFPIYRQTSCLSPHTSHRIL